MSRIKQGLDLDGASLMRQDVGCDYYFDRVIAAKQSLRRKSQMRKIAIGLSLVIFFGAGVVVKSFTPSSAQDSAFLDRRISLLEQRLNMLDSTVSRLQQQSISTSAPPQHARDPEMTLLRTEVELLKSRLKEIECGLTRLDERTLAPAAREAQKRTSAQTQNPCRLFPESPIQVSPHR